MRYTVRPMQENDIPRVSEILCACYRFIAGPDGFSPEQLAAILKERGSVEAVRHQFKEYRWLVACDDQVAGAVAVKENEITKLYVDPTTHRQGIGKLLFYEAERIISASGHQEVTLGTTGHGVPFYRSLGMEVVNRKRCAHGPLVGNEVTLMSKPIMH
ncbi:MAG: GNAT family N-acetyltransferase [Elusimicrobiota bacterium]